MKRKLALLLSFMLLTGCTDSLESVVETAEQTSSEAGETSEQIARETVETAEQAATASTAVKTTTAAATTASPIEETAEPDESQQKYIAPLFTNDEELWRVSEDFSHVSIKEQIGYDTPIDITQLYDYEAAKKWAESFPETLEQAVAQNYSYIYFDEIYVGNDSADWLCSAVYVLNVDGPPSDYYTKLFYVKDGKVTKYVMQGEYHYCQLKYDHTGENIIIGTGNGIYSLARTGGEPVMLTDTDTYCRIHYIADEYMLYSDNDCVVEVYYFDTDENFVTDIYYGFQDAAAQGLVSNTIVYYNFECSDYRSFDIMLQKYADDISEDDFGMPTMYNYDTVKDETYTAGASGTTVAIHGNSTDISKHYNLDGLNVRYVDLLGFFEGNLYLKVYSYGAYSYLVILDVETDRAQIFLLDELMKEGYNLIEYTLDPLTGAVSYYSYKNDMVGIVDFMGGKPSEKQLINEDGTLTDSFTARCIELIAPYQQSEYNVLPDLWDFDRDGLPELIMIYHDSNEGDQTAKVYRVDSGECIGEFTGYNRDGFTRFSYDGEDTVIHSYYDVGDFRGDRWDKLCVEEGRLSVIDSELKTAEFNGVSFNWNDGDALRYSSNFEWCVRGELEYLYRRAEEFALFDYQSMASMDNSEILPLLTEKYNSYAVLEAVSVQLGDVVGYFPDDYNNDGRPEAFVQTDDLCFISSSHEVTTISEYHGYAAYKVDDSLVLQMLSNGMPCEVWSVSKEGKPVKSQAASMLMDFDYSVHDSAVYAGFDSAYDGNAVGGHHTWKPYYFVLDANGEFVPLNVEKVTAQHLLSEFGEYGVAVHNTLDEIAEMGGEVTQIYTRGYGRTMFININYIVPEIIPTVDSDGNDTEFQLDHHYYITLKVNGRYISELERGSGHYSEFDKDTLHIGYSE